MRKTELTLEAICVLVMYWSKKWERNLALPFEKKDHGYHSVGMFVEDPDGVLVMVETGVVYFDNGGFLYNLRYCLEKDKELQAACILGLRNVGLLLPAL